MKKRTTIIVSSDWMEMLKELEQDEFYAVMMGVLNYAFNGVAIPDPGFMSRVEKVAFAALLPRIEHYEPMLCTRGLNRE